MAWAPIAAAGITAVSSMMANSGNKPSRMQRSKDKLVDKLMQSLYGDGEFSDLFNVNEDAFNKSIADPARARFKNQTAPGIQQQFIATGQQRGTGLEDTLTRAGVDMDQLINASYMDYYNQAQQNKLGAMNSILGASGGAPAQTSMLSAAGQGVSGYLASTGFANSMDKIMNKADTGNNQVRPGYAGPKRNVNPNNFVGVPPQGYQYPE